MCDLSRRHAGEGRYHGQIIDALIKASSPARSDTGAGEARLSEPAEGPV